MKKIDVDRKFNIYSSLISKGISEESGNIGENPSLDNTEITEEIKESSAS